MEVFQDYAYYYNAFYKDKDYQEEARQIDYILKRYNKKIKSIINFGCGTGRHDIELSRLGYEVSGIDMSEKMIEIAKKNATNENIEIKYAVCDVRTYYQSPKYDAVISMFHVMSYQNSNQDILAAFKAARGALEEGALFLFDVWYGPGVLTDLPVVRVKEVEDDKYKLVRIARPVMHDKKNLVDVNYEVMVIEKKTGNTKLIKEIHNMRYFFKPELELLLDIAGFELIDNIDCKTLQEASYSSWTSYFIARAR